MSADPSAIDPDHAATLPPAGAPLTLPQAATPLAADRVSVPGYEIVGELGRGGMGVVYKARQVGLNRDVALKMILAGGHASATDLARFKSEAAAVAKLQHPNVVQIYEVGEAGGLPYFSLEYCPGGSLEKVLAGVPKPPREAAALIETLARAVHAAHHAGIVHRDLKPANVLLSFVSGPLSFAKPEIASGSQGTKDQGQVAIPKITDFGLAKQIDSGSGRTASGAILGTPSYMAPEQANGLKEIGPAADTYALGAILYELLTGRPPFRAATNLDTILQVVSSDPVPPKRLNAEVPRDLETIALKCLQKEPAKRYPSAAALADDLHRWQTGEPIAARPARIGERAWRWCRRKPLVAGLLLAVTMALLAGTTISTYFAVRANAKTDEARRLLYDSQLNLAQHAWESDQFDRVGELLDGQRPERTGGTDLRGFEWHYLWRHSHFDVCTLKGHARTVNDVCFSLNGQRLASASADGTVKTWDPSTGKEIATFKGRGGAVTCLAYCPDNRRLAGGSDDATVTIWDMIANRDIDVLKGHGGRITSLAYSPDGRSLASASVDGTVRVWDAKSGQGVLTFKGHGGPVYSVAFSPDGKRLASASRDQTVKVWDASTAKEAFTLRGHGGDVVSVAFSPDGRCLASVSPWFAKTWDAATGKPLLTFRASGTLGHLVSVAFSPDSKWLAACDGYQEHVSGQNYHDENRTAILVWDVATGQQIFTLKECGACEAIGNVAFGPDASRLSVAHCNDVTIWDLTPTRQALIIKAHVGGVLSAAFSPDGHFLATGGQDNAIRVWQTNTGQEVFVLTGHAGPVTSVRFSPDGQRLASGSRDASVRTWDLKDRKAVWTFALQAGTVWRIGFSPDGSRVGIGADGGRLLVLDAANGKQVASLKDIVGPVTSFAFHPDGKRIASGVNDYSLMLWDMTSGQQRMSLLLGNQQITSLSFSPDGKRMAGGTGPYKYLADGPGAGGEVRVVDVSTLYGNSFTDRDVLVLKGHANAVTDVAFHPDGIRVASSSADRTVKVWDAVSGLETLTLSGFADTVTGVTFSPDGWRLAAASLDGTVRIWDATPPSGHR